MKFEFWTTPGYSHLKAIVEKSDSRVGKREEGAGTQIRLKTDIVTFDYEVKNIHPDILGLLCLVTFYPFVGKEVEFPKPVSSRLYNAFQNKIFTSRKDITFRNISDDVELYHGEKIALSFGGGIDSSAVREMFPEAFVIHEAHVQNGELVPSDSHKIVEDLQPNNGRLVKTNIRYLSQPGDWHSWPCSASTSLLMATDLNVGLIMIASILGACFLSNGVQFWDRIAARKHHGPSGNYWQSAFEAIGCTMFSPVVGVSEMQTMKLSSRLLKEKKVVYCMDSAGSACLKCSKCFRRDVIRAFIDEKHSPQWSAYDTDSIHQFLAKKPLFMGHIFSSAFSLKPEIFPAWILQKAEGVPVIESDWAMRVYSDAFALCPEQWREYISTRVLQFIDPMTESDKEQLRKWDQTALSTG